MPRTIGWFSPGIELQNIKVILCDVQNKVPITKDTYDCIWECAAQIIANVLVEGYSNAKVCSTGGRALMQLDFIQLTSNFESITNLKPMPYQEYVLTFIKAFYLSEENLESWIKQQSVKRIFWAVRVRLKADPTMSSKKLAYVNVP
ncbi:hypothetical protein TKK_0001657 [Trichogramma kaykai]